jgi:hypothetical protein
MNGHFIMDIRRNNENSVRLSRLAVRQIDSWIVDDWEITRRVV